VHLRGPRSEVEGPLERCAMNAPGRRLAHDEHDERRRRRRCAKEQEPRQLLRARLSAKPSGPSCAARAPRQPEAVPLVARPRRLLDRRDDRVDGCVVRGAQARGDRVGHGHDEVTDVRKRRQRAAPACVRATGRSRGRGRSRRGGRRRRDEVPERIHERVGARSDDRQLARGTSRRARFRRALVVPALPLLVVLSPLDRSGRCGRRSSPSGRTRDPGPDDRRKEQTEHHEGDEKRRAPSVHSRAPTGPRWCGEPADEAMVIAAAAGPQARVSLDPVGSSRGA
jgi:hypothetical protein